MLKSCSRCKQTKPDSDFYRRKSSLDGLDSWCKSCNHGGRDRNNYLAKKQGRYQDNAEMRRRERRQYYQEHREQESKRAARYYQNKQIDLIHYGIRYRNENRELINQKRRAFYQQNRVKEMDWHRIWMRKNPIKIRAYNHNRRARNVEATGSFTASQFQELCAQYQYRCLACGKIKPLTIDHVIPLAKGGSNSISNIQPLCKECNCKKHTQTIDYRYLGMNT